MVMCRDFNESGPMRANWQIRNFRNCLSECELHDLGFQGTSFTWCNNQHEPNTVRERLDRAWSNLAWLHLFPNSRVQHAQSLYLDHSPLVVELGPVAIKQLLKGHKQFRFEASWLQEADCEKLVTRGWKSPVWSPFDNVLKEKISMISTILCCWGKMIGKETTKRIKELENNLVSLQQNAVNEKIFSSNRPLYDDIQWGIKALPVVVDTSMAETLQLPLTEDKGDPLTLDLFLLYTESRSSLFRLANERGTIPGVAVCRGAPMVSHPLFADDTMIFCPANPTTVGHVWRTLQTYRKAFGQEINLSKSSVAFSRNTLMGLQTLLVESLGIRLDNKHEVYLGLPAVAFW
ncbi:UNVERIFIED_CONTAM: hypothetical protein Scaly_0598100 [Sesamum calycinum]|uniref:Reverse transcriptase n=1 Tax=Sesamum calycinum TaxID=2727403 RepID=A0AAW2RSV4_9LAMI